MFLEPGEPRRVLAKKLQYLLLLALRIAVLVLLALAFAQPALWRPPQAAGGDGARLHLIVLDRSASMGVRGPLGARARGGARRDRGLERRATARSSCVAGAPFEVLGAADGRRGRCCARR